MVHLRNKVLIQGTFTGGEVWSTGLTFGSGSGGSVVSDQEGLTEWALAIADYMEPGGGLPGALRALLSEDGSITRIVTQYFNTDNVLGLQGEAAPVGADGQDGSVCPYSTAMVFSMSTGIPGRRYRGRSYWPALGAGVLAGRISTTDQASQLSSFASMIGAISTAAPVGAAPDLAVHSSIGAGLVTPVTSLRLGRVPDSQRRRRDALGEEYISTAV